MGWKLNHIKSINSAKPRDVASWVFFLSLGIKLNRCIHYIYLFATKKKKDFFFFALILGRTFVIFFFFCFLFSIFFFIDTDFLSIYWPNFTFMPCTCKSSMLNQFINLKRVCARRTSLTEKMIIINVILNTSQSIGSTKFRICLKRFKKKWIKQKTAVISRYFFW